MRFLLFLIIDCVTLHTVTLSWWDDLWLNEGFASYIEYKGVDEYHKDWDMVSKIAKKGNPTTGLIPS